MSKDKYISDLNYFSILDKGAISVIIDFLDGPTTLHNLAEANLNTKVQEVIQNHPRFLLFSLSNKQKEKQYNKILLEYFNSLQQSILKAAHETEEKKNELNTLLNIMLGRDIKSYTEVTLPNFWQQSTTYIILQALPNEVKWKINNEKSSKDNSDAYLLAQYTSLLATTVGWYAYYVHRKNNIKKVTQLTEKSMQLTEWFEKYPKKYESNVRMVSQILGRIAFTLGAVTLVSAIPLAVVLTKIIGALSTMCALFSPLVGLGIFMGVFIVGMCIILLGTALYENKPEWKKTRQATKKLTELTEVATELKNIISDEAWLPELKLQS